MEGPDPVCRTYVRKPVTTEQRKGNSTAFSVVRVHLGEDEWLVIKEDGSYSVIAATIGWDDSWVEVY